VWVDPSGGTSATVNLPTAPNSGDITIVKADGPAIGAQPKVTARGGFTVENPSNPGNYSAANGTVTLVNPGQVVWWQFSSTKWGQIV